MTLPLTFQEGRDAVTIWLDGVTPWMVSATLAATVLVLTALMYRNERRKRPRGRPSGTAHGVSAAR